jgi:hypothetical protein
MKTFRIIAIVLAGIAASLPTQAASVVSGDITSNVSPTFTTADTYLMLNGYADSASTVPANLTSDGPSTWFGVDAGSALSGTETMTLQLAPGYGLIGFGDIYTRAVITISGFVSDPGLDVGSNPGVLGSSYSAGTLMLDLNWNGGGARDFILADVSASAGQLLTISLDSITSPQWAITHLDYAVVPEPTAMSFALLGLGLLIRRGTRR